MPHWTPDDMPDLTGRIALVTGANSGIGFHTALELARHGARTLMACRNTGRAEAGVRRLVAAVPGSCGSVEVVRLDLASLESVRDAAAEIADRAGAVDILVNNAGVMAPSSRRTEDGFELQFGTNHLGHFALTGRLLPLLLAADAPRVVTVSSIMHRSAKPQWAVGSSASGSAFAEEPDPNRWTAYGRSKLANLMFARELARRSLKAGTALVSVAVHPGYASSGLVAKSAIAGRSAATSRLSGLIVRVTGQSSAAGAWPSLYGATVSELFGGEYIGPRGPGELRGAPGPARVSRAALDDIAAGLLWDVSVTATGVGYEELGA